MLLAATVVGVWLAHAGGTFALDAAGPAADEPAPPGQFARPLECVPLDGIEAGAPLVLRCAVKPGVDAVTVLLWLRRAGSEDFVAAPTLRSRKGWYTAAVCGDSFTPGVLHYYVEALDPRGRLLASHGNEDSPNLLTVRRPAGAPPVLATASSAVPVIDDSDPLARVRAERQAEQALLAPGPRSRGSIVTGLAAGYGYGWHPDRALDFRSDIQAVPGTRTGGLVLTPELGYHLTERVTTALALRWGSLPASGAGDGHQGSPARHAWAVLLRGGYLLGSGRLQLHPSAAVGAGDGFRLLVRPDPGAQLTRNDSVRGGPVVAGAGVGLLYHLGRRVALTTDLRAFAGLPRFAAVLDINAGVQLSFAR